ncbi:hypothetical protein BU15DRAFT_48642 [Melanogaster broomeanus]|nr:hypothetical protein BU15DRAFT_48642 [Melanogaster broomeanus]
MEGNVAEHPSDQRATYRLRLSSTSLEVTSVETPRACPISSLPVETLHFIMENAVPPSFFLDPSIGRGPFSAWCQKLRQLKYFVLVCRWWRDVGIDLLYRDVVIRRIGQIPALLRSLEANPMLGPMVRSLRIDCFVPRGYKLVLEGGLNQICAFCTHNTQLVFNHTTDGGFPELPEIDGSTLSSIVGLEIGPGYPLPLMISLVVQCTSLTRLTISFQGFISPDDIPAAHFTFLEELHCTCTSEGNLLAVISTQWSLPSLRRFSIIHHAKKISDMDYYSFLEEHGKNLTYLSICAWPLSESEWLFRRDHMDPQRFLDLCPFIRKSGR